jgi:hypothetical protein
MSEVIENSIKSLETEVNKYRKYAKTQTNTTFNVDLSKRKKICISVVVASFVFLLLVKPSFIYSEQNFQQVLDYQKLILITAILSGGILFGLYKMDKI